MSNETKKSDAVDLYQSLIANQQIQLDLSFSQACALIKVFDRGFPALSPTETDLFYSVIREMKLQIAPK